MTNSEPRRSCVMYANYFTHTKPHSVAYKDGLSFYLFRLQAEGTCRALVAGTYETIIPGDLLIYAPDQPYELNVQPRSAPGSDAVQPVADYFLIGNGEWLDAWWKDKGLPAKTNIGFDDTVISLWKHIINEKKKVMQNQEEIMDYLLRTLCLTLEQVIQTKQRAKGADTAYKLKLFIEHHAHEPLSLEEISASVGLSVSRCSYLFKAAFGQSLFAYCIDVRLKLAQQQVLYSNLALEQVAEKTGFQSYPHFCRVFRERFGHPPGEYRRQFGFGINHD
ncbi:AraC family transcriptional regulator, arabinose operon regulatory protein [Paenibacillus sp. UNCCL117]|uniref:helix-turn-helix domain-containing protein n=1 Tax=unclassified Paenibacillus TaxID=185978 RepID=UPI000883439A|nr:MULTISPECIES: AraC family transcriptional regulator [unclassified Paenibacillus]SDE43296.1 AraC family transcriptional regulator, arabinose operon regulatory protein [Paenibacillus sp. cl123]SFW45959.1 AraC family transcriptional regulator, arabinose operon regulatory protein [Paenibacillus sp. UNCCL117]